MTVMKFYIRPELKFNHGIVLDGWKIFQGIGLQLFRFQRWRGCQIFHSLKAVEIIFSQDLPQICKQILIDGF